MSDPRQRPTDRRGFLGVATHGALAAGLAAGAASARPDEAPRKPVDPPRPVTLPGWLAPTERKAGGPPNPLPPGQRVGFAVVGLGHLALEQILPAFGACTRARPVALVSGDRDKAGRVARQYGVPEKFVYDYKHYDALRDNPAVEVVYVVLPNNMHLEYTARAAAAGKHVLW